MFNFITNFFKKNQTQAPNLCNVYNEQYRNSYNKLWIKNLGNYNP